MSGVLTCSRSLLRVRGASPGVGLLRASGALRVVVNVILAGGSSPRPWRFLKVSSLRGSLFRAVWLSWGPFAASSAAQGVIACAGGVAFLRGLCCFPRPDHVLKFFSLFFNCSFSFKFCALSIGF